MKKYKLSEICFNITDGTHSTVIDDKQSNYFLLSCKNIKDGKINISKNDRKISIETLKSLRKRTKMELNDVVLTSVGTIGQSSYIRESNPPFEFQRSVAILKPNLNYVLSQYLHYYFISSIGQSNIQSRIKGAAQPCLFLNDIKTMEIMLPEFQVQQHIVDTIGSVDNLIEKYEEIINKNSKIFNYLYDKNTQTIEVVLQDIAEIKYGKGLTASDLSFNNKYKVYGGNGIIGTLPTYEHENNKIAISCRGAASGNLLLTEKYSTISSNSLYLNLYNETHFADIYYYLLKANLTSLTTGSAQPQITIENIKDLKIKICTNSLLNQKGKQILDSNFKHNKKIDKLKEIKETLLQKYFG